MGATLIRPKTAALEILVPPVRDLRQNSVRVRADGLFLDGGRSYALRVPATVPVQSYWSLTAYDAEHFDLVAAPSARPNVSSIMAPEM